MRVNPTTMLFEDMTDDEADEVMATAEAIVFGTIPCPLPKHIDLWVDTCGVDRERQWLLMMSTAYPQRALLSVARHYQGRAHNDRHEVTHLKTAKKKGADEDEPIADTEVASVVAAMSDADKNHLKKFTIDGLCSDAQKRALKKHALVKYSGMFWHLTTLGRTVAERVGYL
jgi:hypothetical protein